MAKLELIPSSYQLTNGKWVPIVTKRIHIGGRILEKKLDDWEEQFETKELVDAFVNAEIEKIKIDG